MSVKINWDVTIKIKEIETEMTNTDTDEMKIFTYYMRLEHKECETLPDKAFEQEGLWKYYKDKTDLIKCSSRLTAVSNNFHMNL